MGNYTLLLSDIINKTGIEHDDIALIRHTPSQKNFKEVWCAGMGMFEEYQKIQPKDYFHGKNFIFSFIGEVKNTARFLGVYRIKSIIPLTKELVKPDYFSKYAYIHNFDKDYYFDLEKLDILGDLVERLVIDYGATRNIVHCNWETIARKPVIGINSKVFTSFDEIIWNYSDLEKYIGHEERYVDLYTALSNVNGVYLIVDTTENKQYVGSAYGEEGIWGRWREYLNSKGTGGNKKMKSYLSSYGNYNNLQFSVLETIPKTGNALWDKNFVLEREKVFKKKLMTRNDVTGLNLN